ncbi:hypothetical protein ILYODFUR_021882 [Ilyodon furcidens]|uniref:Uncharacterized protein n=1 Tax=Ilyodon furcidens TaxID=33524 RepID=A0ABV0TKU4_9TELE
MYLLVNVPQYRTFVYLLTPESNTCECLCIQGFSIKICNSECEEPQTFPPGPGTDMEDIRTTDIQRPPRAQEPQENQCWDYRNPPGRAGESPRENTQQRKCRSPRELQRRAHRPQRQLSTLEQIQPWTQRPETPRHITPQAEAQ